jgi:hypothetical protein
MNIFEYRNILPLSINGVLDFVHSLEIQKIKERNVSETGSVPVLRRWKEVTYSVGSVRKSWRQSVGTQQNMCLPPITWGWKQVQLPKLCFLTFRIAEDGQDPEPRCYTYTPSSEPFKFYSCPSTFYGDLISHVFCTCQAYDIWQYFAKCINQVCLCMKFFVILLVNLASVFSCIKCKLSYWEQETNWRMASSEM